MMDDAEKAKELLLINTKEEEIAFAIKSEIQSVLEKPYTITSKIEIKNMIRSIISKYEREGILKRALLTTNGDYRFNIELTIADKTTQLVLNLNKV